LQYSRAVRRRLDEVERDALELRSRGAGGGSIELGVVPSFATHWLVPRLSRFYAENPGVQVNLHVRTRPFLFEAAGLDAAIHAGRGGWPGTRADHLMPEPMVVVCAPALTGRRKRLAPADLVTMPLVQMTTRPDAWRHWFLAHGVNSGNPMAGARVELFSMAIQAAIHGIGVALVPDYLAQDELWRGLLCSPVQGSSDSGYAYHFIHPEGDDSPPALGVFRDWLLREASG
jgi:DNA-binding transcriptional LysR family regulator